MALGSPRLGDSGARACGIRRGHHGRSAPWRGAARSDIGRGARRLLSDGCPFHCGAMAEQAGAERACRGVTGGERGCSMSKRRKDAGKTADIIKEAWQIVTDME